MKILRSKGESFTKIEKIQDDTKNEIAVLRRGLDNLNRSLTCSEKFACNRVSPDDLANFLTEEYSLVLRQTISALDKTIRKPPSLREFTTNDYVYRTQLANSLWIEFCHRFKDNILNLPNGEEAFSFLEAMWVSKIHPYAEFPCDFDNPQTDRNATIIEDARKHQPIKKNFSGRWKKAFERCPQGNRPDHRKTAQVIFKHLLEQELTVTGEEKEDRSKKPPQPTNIGLIKRRGIGISRSTNLASDLRASNRPFPDRNSEVTDGDTRLMDEYFADDFAASIYQKIIAKLNKKEEQAYRFKNIGQVIGAELYLHCGNVLVPHLMDKKAKEEIFDIHNAVRKNYQKIVRSDRFRRACREMRAGSEEKLSWVFPRNNVELKSLLNAKGRNAEISELIRLGKIIAHSSEHLLKPQYTDQETLNEAFSQKMAYYSTSDGQSEIKRKEAFTRIWRNSIALSLRSLEAWIDPERKAEVNVRGVINRDLADPAVAENALGKKQFEQQWFKNHASLLFGNDTVPSMKDGSRTDKLITSSPGERKEMAWAMLRIVGELRDRVNHFNTMDRVIEVVADGILKEVTETQAPKRIKNKTTKETLNRFKNLLDFDIKLQKKALLDDLNRIKVKQFMGDNATISGLAKHLSPPEGDCEIIPPKYWRVLNKLHKMAQDIPDTQDETQSLISEFSKLNLFEHKTKNELTEKVSANRFRIDLLGQLYSSGFQTWLSKHQDTEQLRSILLTVIAEEKKRNEYDERPYKKSLSKAEEFGFAKASTLSELFGLMLSEIMRDERDKQTYSPNRKQQSHHSSWVEHFKLRLFAHLFATFLKEIEIHWIWDVVDLNKESIADTETTIEDLSEIEPTGYINKKYKSWHSQFYAWLYLLPPDNVSKLKNQITKTKILTNKSRTQLEFTIKNEDNNEDNNEDDLEEMKQLMQLYTRTQSAGFAGNEHETYFELERKGSIFSTFFENSDHAEILFSQSEDLSATGTRRGIRQLLRFGNLEVISSIIKKHRVTGEELASVGQKLQSQSPASKNSHQSKDLPSQAKEIEDLAQQTPVDMDDLINKSYLYQSVSTIALDNKFTVEGCRLTDFTRTHYIMMKIIGRLLDYTLMWERDRHYLLLGTLFKALNGKMKLSTKTDPENAGSIGVGIELPLGPIQDNLKAVFDACQNSSITQDDADNGFIPLWNPTRGFCLESDWLWKILPESDEKAQFEKYFVKVEIQNRKDANAKDEFGNNLRQAGHQKHGEPKAKIRNDFAHFNIISPIYGKSDPKTHGPKYPPLVLTYRINAVRSLFGYDRKVKNRVAGSIQKILEQEGLTVSWVYRGDRLSKPKVLPLLREELYFLPQEYTSLKFHLPKTSMRLVSMVQALLDFGSSGYRSKDGILKYPSIHAAEEGKQLRIPDQIAQKSLKFASEGR